MARKGGFVLGFVLVLILSLTILFGCLLAVPGGVSRQVSRYERKVQGVYDAESAILANLAGLPDGFIDGLPHVVARSDGVWGHVCAPLRNGDRAGNGELLCADYGVRYSRFRFDDWFAAMTGFRENLRESIADAPGFRTLSGNRRFFLLDSSVALHVVDGDLLLDFDSHVPSGAFLVDGSVTVKGRARFDTLRIYAGGDVLLGGDSFAGHLVLYSAGSVNASSGFAFHGMLAARNDVLLGGKSRGEFPSIAVAIGSGASNITLSGHASFTGLLAAPGGNVEIGSPDSLRGGAFPGVVTDSSRMLLPAFFDGEPQVFRRSVVR